MDLLSTIMWLTLNIYHEARSDDKIGKIAVAHVTLNRVHNRRQTMKAVVLEPKQFSWTHQKKSWTPQDLEALAECFESAVIALNGYDFTQGATHYHRVDVHPKWAKKKTYIGNSVRTSFTERILPLKPKSRNSKSLNISKTLTILSCATVFL